MQLESLPTARDMEEAAAILNGEAAKLAVFVTDGVSEGHWEAPQGGPPAPGAAEQAQALLRVAQALEGVTEPLRAYEAHSAQGGNPYEFLMAMIGEGLNA